GLRRLGVDTTISEGRVEVGVGSDVFPSADAAYLSHLLAVVDTPPSTRPAQNEFLDKMIVKWLGRGDLNNIYDAVARWGVSLLEGDSQGVEDSGGQGLRLPRFTRAKAINERQAHTETKARGWLRQLMMIDGYVALAEGLRRGIYDAAL